MRFFNTAGPVRLEDHYHIPPLDRLNLAEVRALIREEKYFVLRAPRQTGKTSWLLALRDLLDAEGEYRCVYVNVEPAQALREDVERATQVILGELASRARLAGDEFLDAAWLDLWTRYGAGALREALTRWAEASPKPVVLLIDEIDSLIGDSLLAVLRQLRAGYDLRPEGFSQSVVLCGVRDVRDYRIQSTAENAMIAGGSAFNIKAESLRLGDFSAGEARTLLAQHTLADKLKEERVRRVVEPLLSGGEKRGFADRDLEYVRDLGLIAQDRPPRMANPIYAEVVPRELTWVMQEEFEQEAAWYVDAGGELDVDRLMSAFQAFFREHSEHWVGRFQYQEAGPQLLLQAFLQRIVNSGGRIEREYGLGRGRTDLLILWPEGEGTRKVVIECKILHKSLERTVAEGVEQTAGYMDRCGAEAGHLVIFDRREDSRWADKVFHDRRTSAGGAAIEVWGM